MGARIGALVFWCFLALNTLAAAGLAHLLPDYWALPPTRDGDMPLPGVPLRPLVGFLLCLPTAWMGVKRLHDLGRRGWPVLPPLLALGAVLIGPAIVPRLALTLIGLNRDGAVAVNPMIAGKIYIAVLLLGGLFLAAGTLRTIFLWMQPGDADRNPYGPAPATAGPSAVRSKTNRILGGRMRRLSFWPVLIANVAVVRTISYLVAHWSWSLLPHWLTHGDLAAFGELTWIVIAPLLSPCWPVLAKFTALPYLPAFWAAARRLHDQDRSGLLAGLVLLLNIGAPFAERFLGQGQVSLMNLAVDFPTFYLLFLCLQKGNIGDNRYGPPPGTAPLPQAPFTPPPPRPAQKPAAMPAASPMPASASRRFGRRGA